MYIHVLQCLLGILAGVWPCGTVTMLGELYTAESMTQVYAFLHTFMHENEEALKDLSKLMVDCNCYCERGYMCQELYIV